MSHHKTESIASIASNRGEGEFVASSADPVDALTAQAFLHNITKRLALTPRMRHSLIHESTHFEREYESFPDFSNEAPQAPASYLSAGFGFATSNSPVRTRSELSEQCLSPTESVPNSIPDVPASPLCSISPKRYQPDKVEVLVSKSVHDFTLEDLPVLTSNVPATVVNFGKPGCEDDDDDLTCGLGLASGRQPSLTEQVTTSVSSVFHRSPTRSPRRHGETNHWAKEARDLEDDTYRMERWRILQARREREFCSY